MDEIGGSTRHGVCVIDDNGMVIKSWMVEHTENGIAALFLRQEVEYIPNTVCLWASAAEEQIDPGRTEFMELVVD